MAALAPILARLGLGQYLDRFVAEGFDTWDTLLEITEADLEELDVKLGHRRKLQREIAISRGAIAGNGADARPANRTTVDGQYGNDEKIHGEKPKGASSEAPGGKRKYRRHPKMREHLRPQNLSFTEIAKRVGEQWQLLDPQVKGQYESRAASAKEKYHADLAQYKTTDNCREYEEYLHSFNLKRADDKRAKIDKAPSATSSQSPEQDENSEPHVSHIPSRHRKAESFGSSTTYSMAHDHPSPTAASTISSTPSSFARPPYFKPSSPSSAAVPGPWVQRGSRNSNHIFGTADRPPLTPVDSHRRNPSMERTELRSTPSHLTSLLQDSDMLHARSSPFRTLQRESSQSSTSSPVSSAFSSSVNQAQAYQSSLNSMSSSITSPAASNPPRRLPPLHTIVGPSPEPGRPPKNQLQGHLNFRPDFSAVPLPPVTSATPASTAPTRNIPSPPRPDNKKPSFKGEYEARPSFGEESRFSGGGLYRSTDRQQQEPSFKGTETQAPKVVKSEYDSESQAASSGKSGYESDASLSSLQQDADPLRVLACAGRMVDREERRGRSRRIERRDP
ncbi:MAG: hypothetical protein Q9195_005977 [Heterodermia aff. obscurata]